MKTEIMMIGTELLLGQITDTNAVFMGQILAENGVNLHQKTTVGDNQARIVAALDAALDRADVILCSGGLGPTEDDITRECVAEVTGRPLEFHPEVWETIRARFAHFKRPVTDNNKRQAMVPRGAEVIENPNGTAPGLIAECARGAVVCMPGVPHELKPMMADSVIPWLRRRYGINGVLRHRSLKVCGMGESRVDALMGDLILKGANPTVGLLAGPDGVVVRIAARAESAEAADALMDPVEAEVQRRLGGIAFGRDNEPVERALDALLTARGWRMALGEVCTGGVIAAKMTAIGAASFGCGVVFTPEEAAQWAGYPPDGGNHFSGGGVDLTARLLVDWPFACALAVTPMPGGGSSLAVFACPEGVHRCELGRYGGGALGQNRLAVMAMEQARRFLAGLPLE